MSPGASVTLSCEVKPSSAGWRFYWYKAVPELYQNKYKYLLVPGSDEGTKDNYYKINDQKHTAGYACRAGRGNPELFTQFSEPKFVCYPTAPRAVLTVSPSWLSPKASITLSCQVEPPSTLWRFYWYKAVPDQSKYSYSSRWQLTAVYWCESGSGRLSNAINITIHATPKAVLTVSPQWASPGASVTLSCEVKPSSPGWRFYWYKAVPELSNTYKYYSLPQGTHETPRDSYVVHDQKHTSRYACRAGWGVPQFFTNYSEPKIVWPDSHPAAALSVSPDRDIYTVDEVQLTCTGSSGDWKSYYQSDSSNCTVWGNMTGSSCTFMSSDNDEAVYWCESGSGEFSNAVNITLKSAPRPKLTVSPSWLSPGASVTLSCEVEPPSAGWRFYWYKAVPDLSNGYTYDLLSDSIKGTVQDSYVVLGQKRTAGYACRAGIGNPETFTNHRNLKQILVLGENSDSHPAASLTVSPDREKLYIVDDIQLKCTGSSTDWRVRRIRQSYNHSDVSDCSSWGTMTGSSCSFSSLQYNVALYWCESESGEFSNAVNITVHHEGLLLVSPVHPVTEGASVTLSCRLRGENKLSDVIFYHNDKLIQNDSRGELKISAVSQSDEGFYKCEHSGEVSPQSWMGVKAVLKKSSSSFPVMWAVGPLCGIVLLLLLLLLIRF
uniref:Ig-like domain-containing protein n=1 Tax=Poecilia formosa TaxID=48698 RepID=A0A096LWW0_POEFO